MTVSEILQDIIWGLPKDIFQRYGEQGILRAINRIYKNLNRELLCLEKELEITETSTGYSLPADWIKAFACDDDDLVYVNPEVFDPDENGFYTIRANKMYFGSPATDNSVKFYYYSSGLTLVSGTPLAGQVSTPEWQEASLHSILIYGARAELSKKHDGYVDDVLEFRRLKIQLGTLNYERDSISPSRIVPHQTSPKNRYIDDYEKP